MNKKTLWTLAVLATLIALSAIVEKTPGDEGLERLTIPGFLDNPKMAVTQVGDLLNPSLDRIQFSSAKGSITVVNELGTWLMTAPRRAALDPFRVKAMLLPLQTPSTSLFSKRIPEGEEDLYGLGKDAIEVEVFDGEELFAAFIVGEIAKSEDPDAGKDEVDTWVQKPGTDLVFRMAGKDLRTPFQDSPSELRNKNIFLFSKEEIRRITLHNPTNSAVPKLILENTAPLSKTGKNDPEDWAILEPKGFEIGSISGTLNSFANLRATLFSPEGVTLETAGLRDEDSPFRAEIRLRAGEVRELRIGKTLEKTTYGTVVGSDEIFEMHDYTAINIQKGIDDVRNRRVLGIKAGAVEEIRLHASGVTLRRLAGGWRMIAPEGIPISQGEVEAFLHDLEGWTVTGFADGGKAEERGLATKDAPEKVTIQHNGTSSTLLIGAAQGEVHWAKREGSDSEIWKLTSFMAEKLRGKGPDNFRERTVFGFLRDDIQSVHLIHPIQTLIIEQVPGGKNENKWKVIRGEDVLEEPKPELVSTILSSISNLQVKHFTRGVSRKEAGLQNDDTFRAEITLQDGSQHVLEISETKKGKEPYAAAPKTGIWQDQIFTMNPFQADNIRKKYKDFRIFLDKEK